MIYFRRQKLSKIELCMSVLVLPFFAVCDTNIEILMYVVLHPERIGCYGKKNLATRAKYLFVGSIHVCLLNIQATSLNYRIF